ncbi:MAG: hypothetical protein NTY38_19395 [Acidobacteria bacterium]|nr:hypothetical protein [Acidobacteriota bacterium]
MKHRGCSRLLVIAGLAGMLLGAVDPLEGSVIILAGAGVGALAAFLAGSRHRRLMYWSFALVAAGVAAMFVLSAFGGVGGPTGHSKWWVLVVLPYPAGWIMGLVGSILGLAWGVKPSPAQK